MSQIVGKVLTSIGAGVLIALPTSAATVSFDGDTDTLTIDGAQYQLSVETDVTFEHLQPLLTNTPWASDADLAREASLSVGFDLGFLSEPDGFNLSLTSCPVNIQTSCLAAAPYFVFEDAEGTQAAFRFEAISAQVPGTIPPVLVTSGVDVVNIGADFNAGNVGFVIAQPSPVPEPLTILGSLSALGVGMMIRRKYHNRKS